MSSADAVARKSEVIEAFERFSQASKRLEERYLELRAETDDLRSRLRVKEQQVKRSERLALLGETAAAIAHEVRNPLGAMKLFVSLLREDVVDRPTSLEIVMQLDKSIDGIEHVVANILRFSRDQKLEFSPLNLHALVQEQVDYQRLAVAGSASAGNSAAVIANEPAANSANCQPAIQFEVEFQGLPFIIGNAEALRQLLSNLILNARQALRTSGLIRIEVADYVEPAAGDGCSAGAGFHGAAAVRLSIRDNGPGITEELLERVFEPFVTTKNEGTGLGLAIVNQIVSQHGGTISVRNVPGAEFTIILPRVAQGAGDDD